MSYESESQADGSVLMDATTFAVETRELRKSFGGRAVLDGADLHVPEGSLAVVMGPSGTGKSVMLKLILGLLKPDGGDVIVEGTRLSDRSGADMQALRREVGVMFQDGALFSSMTVYENVAFPLRQHTDYTDAEIREIVRDGLSDVGLLDAVDRMPAELSGGMKKRAGLARAMVLDPGIVLCDEPDSGLDPVRTALLAELLTERHEARGGTMIVVTHNVALAKAVSDHASLLWNGQIVAEGPAAELWASSDPFVRQFLAGEADGPLTMD
jgi:phospholipid/cholesterol/gamma-HCH transport system ATP-binding protein